MLEAESLNILIVDDNENNLLSLHGIIDEYIGNVHVIEANSGMNALNILMKKQVDLIILDIQMPEMDGFETAEIIRSRKKIQHVPIVFLTAAYKSDEFEKKGYAIGAADYLTKPIDAPQLVSKIKTYLRFIQQEQQRVAELSATNRQLESEIAERTRIEEELRWAKNASEAANRAKSQFLANMSHELRTPLNAIIGYSEILIEDSNNLDECKELIPDLENILFSGKHLLNLINDILDLSKIEAGKMELHNTIFCLPILIQEITHVVQPLAEKRNNILQVHHKNEIPQQMYADEMKIRQILLNLLDNAVKFTEKGQVTVEISYDLAEEGRYISFQVTDTGVGLTPEQMSKLFHSFSQVDSSPTRKYGGSGLGLVISKRFTEMMGGCITVRSHYGKGSSFYVRLPYKISQAS